MTDGALSDAELRQALELLQAIRVLQRWLLARPLGADTLCLTATSLRLSRGQDQAMGSSLPNP